MRIGLVRRGYSKTGGAESYLKRFASALAEAGHQCVLFGTPEWPRQDWNFGEFKPLPGKSPRQFADALRASQPHQHCDFLFSLERVWECDCFRAGDGVHQAWLERRAKYEPRWKSLFRGFNRKHRELLELERHLLTPNGPTTIIANSNLVREEILRNSSYPAERIHVIYNGLPGLNSSEIRPGLPPELAEIRSRYSYLVLFAGSGWERKGLKFAIEGFQRASIPGSVLLVAGRGNSTPFKRVENVRFLGPVTGMREVLAAADAFILPTLYDPFSNASLEALAAGLPVITSAANGMSEIIRPGVDGEVLQEPSDTREVARALSNWSDSGTRESSRLSRLERAGRFTIEANLAQTLAVLGA
jgi:UDP-glucose:(heptosyl)LPS alpha-1,3-glucosyltransferase